MVVTVDHEVVGDRVGPDEAVLVAVLGDMAGPQLGDAAWRHRGGVVAQDLHLPRRARAHGVDHDREEAEVLQRETEEAWTLEQRLARPIELRGFSDIAPLVGHASKGGELDGESLVAIGESLVAASGLLKTLRGAAAAGG